MFILMLLFVGEAFPSSRWILLLGAHGGNLPARKRFGFPFVQHWLAVMEEDPSGVAVGVDCDEAFVDEREDSWTEANPADSEKDFERYPPLLVGLLCLHGLQNQIQNPLLFHSFFFFPCTSMSLKCTLPLKDNL
jgi:hypothetical protein